MAPKPGSTGSALVVKVRPPSREVSRIWWRAFRAGGVSETQAESPGR